MRECGECPFIVNFISSHVLATSKGSRHLWIVMEYCEGNDNTLFLLNCRRTENCWLLLYLFLVSCFLFLVSCFLFLVSCCCGRFGLVWLLVVGCWLLVGFFAVPIDRECFWCGAKDC